MTLESRCARSGEGSDAVCVLLAEDHPIKRRVVELILAEAPVRLTSSADGAAAVAAVEQDVFDLVLMDLQMPVMDGLRATRTIRELETAQGRQRCRICVLTANADTDHRTRSFAAGADFLPKPVHPSNFCRSCWPAFRAIRPR